MRELDELLGGFLEQYYVGLSGAERAHFEAILNLPDPELYSYLLGRETPADPELKQLIQRIRDYRSH